jgi:ABC-2 type transport system ATP-binding protein
MNAIEVEGLVKRFGEKVALGGVSFEVPRGTVCGLLGPNGAGKTTAVRILTTLSEPDAGTARVAGLDVVADPGGVRRLLGLAAQDATVDGLLTGRENLDMIGRLHHIGRATAKRRAVELLEQFALTDAGDRLVKTYSGGMRRRLDLAATLVARPEVLFLDEPTPASTRAPATSCGTCSRPSSTRARRSCSPPSTSRRPTGWRTTSSSSTTARSSPAATPAS